VAPTARPAADAPRNSLRFIMEDLLIIGVIEAELYEDLMNAV
jgi:hypothetical protein